MFRFRRLAALPEAPTCLLTVWTEMAALALLAELPERNGEGSGTVSMVHRYLETV